MRPDSDRIHLERHAATPGDPIGRWIAGDDSLQCAAGEMAGVPYSAVSECMGPSSVGGPTNRYLSAAMRAAADTPSESDAFRRYEQPSRYTLVSIHCLIRSPVKRYAMFAAEFAADGLMHRRYLRSAGSLMGD